MSSAPDQDVISIEPDERLVVLARTLDAASAEAAQGLETEAGDWRQFGETCLGRSLYRHGSIFKGQSDAPVWSHLELAYFRDLVPSEAIDRLILTAQPKGVRLLRAEILATTPRSFVFPLDWAGSSHRLDRTSSLEYLDVDPSHLDDYRGIMRRYIGPAAAKLVAAGRLGTFRTMETAAVLFQDAAFGVTWNQIHLSEVDSLDFQDFGQELDAALRAISPSGGFAGVFAGLEKMRTIPRWTFNELVAGTDAEVGRWARARNAV